MSTPNKHTVHKEYTHMNAAVVDSLSLCAPVWRDLVLVM